MSKTVDQRVVEMRFDNKQFESGVQTSMSTIEKLKQKLKFKDASKGLNELNTAANKVDMSGLKGGIETVQAKFSALQVVGVTALANITNSAVNAGKRMVKALTIDPVITGFQEYETQMGAIQTILANTQKEGTNVDRVNAALDELNLYADQTIYNFTEMTRNIGTFTAAGVKLDESVSAIKGIANLAAVSGSTSQQASTAMYQLSQALAAGKVSLMDWNSVVNAGMGGQVFQDALIRTSEHLKTGAKEAIKTYGSFRESLTKGEWLTKEVLTETLSQIAGAYSEADLMAQGYSESEAKAITQLADTAVSAATEVKTFTQLWDTLKEAAQSGWSATWRTIVGDFEEAKSRMTKLSEIFGNVINASANRRNTLVEGIFGSNWDKLYEKLNAAGIKTEDFQNKVKELAKTHNVNLDEMIKKEGSFENAMNKAFSTKKLDKSIIKDALSGFIDGLTGTTKSTNKASDAMEKYGKIVDKVIRGDFGNGEVRVKKLTDAGYEYAKIQNLVNEKLGSSVRHLESLSEEQLDNADSLAKLSEEQLKNKGFTEDQITALKDLQKAASNSGSSINELINNIDKPPGSELLWDSFTNILDSIVASCKAIKEAWREAFHPGMSEEEVLQQRAEKIYKIVDAFHSLTEKLKVNEEKADKIKRTFKGLFSVLALIKDIVVTGITMPFKALGKVFGKSDKSILDFTAKMGDALVSFKEFVDENHYVEKAFSKIGSGARKAADGIKALLNAFKELPFVQKILEKIGNIDLSEVGTNAINGLKNGLKDGIFSVPEILIEIGKKMLSAIKGVLGIHSPSKEMYDVGENTMAGLKNGMQDNTGGILGILKDLGRSIVDTLGTVNWGKVFAAVFSVMALKTMKNLVDVLGAISEPIAGVGDVLQGTGKILKKAARPIAKILNNVAKVVKSFSKVLNAYAFSIRADAIQKIAVSITMLVAAIIALTFFDPKDLWRSVGIIAVLALILAALAVASSQMASSSVNIGKGGVALKGMKTGLLAIVTSLMILAMTVKMIGKLDPDEARRGFLGLAGLVAAIGAVFLAYGKIVKGKAAQNIDKAGKMVLKLSVALLLLVVVVKLVDKLTPTAMLKGVIFLSAFVIFVGALVAVTKTAGKNIDKVGKMIMKLSTALLLLVIVVKLVGRMSVEEMIKGGLFITAFAVFVGVLTGIVKSAGKDIGKIGKVILAISSSMLILAAVMKIIGKMKWGEMVKAAVGITGLTIIMYALVEMVKEVGPDAPKIATTLLAMSISIGILAGVAVLLGFVKVGNLIKGLTAIGILSAMMSAMIESTEKSKNATKTIVALSMAVAIMAGALVILSFIDIPSLITSIAALGTVMAMFTSMAKSAGMAENAVGTLSAMAVSIAIIGIVIYKLAQLPTGSALTAAASLSAVLLSVSAAMKIVGTLGKIGPEALVSVGIMIAVIIVLGKVLTSLSSMDTGSSLETAKALSVLLLSLSAACLILTGVGAFGPAALIGVASFVAMIAAIGGLMLAIGALSKHFPKMEEFLDKGISILEKIGYGIGSFFGNIVKGFSSAVLSILPEAGKSLSAFMVGAQPFFILSKTIDEDVVKKVGLMAAAIVVLTAANVISGIGNFLSLGQTYADLGHQLSAFAASALPFFAIIKTVDQKSVAAASALADMILKLTTANLIDSIGKFASLFTGGNTSFAQFGEQLTDFGKAVVDFSTTVSGKIDDKSVTAAANAGMAMSELGKALPREGGFIQKIIGEKDLKSFGSKCKAFGEAIVTMSKSLTDDNGSVLINQNAVDAAVTAGKAMTEIAKAIPKSGGFLQDIVGEKDLKAFGSKCKAFGEAMRDMSNSLTGEEGKILINQDAINSAVTAGNAMAKVAESMPKSGGILQGIVGVKDIALFGSKCKAFGEAIRDMSGSLVGEEGASLINQDAISQAVTAGQNMTKVAESIPTDKIFDGKVAIDDFGKKIKKYGEHISSYSETVSGVDFGIVSTSVTASQKLADFAGSIVELDEDKIDSFKNIKDIGDAIKDYYNKVQKVDTTIVASSISSAEKLRSLVSSLKSFDSSGISNFTVDTLGTKLKSYYDNMSGIDIPTLSSSITTINKLSNTIKGMSNLDPSVASNFNSAVDTLGKANISGLTATFSGASSKLSGIGTSLMSNLANGMKSGQGSVISTTSRVMLMIQKQVVSKASAFKSAGQTIMKGLVAGVKIAIPSFAVSVSSGISSAITSIRLKYFGMYNAGTYLGSGLVSGINAKKTSVYWAGYALGQEAVRGEKDGQKSHSPSKLTIQAGKWLGEGLIIGIKKMGTKVYSSGSDLGNKVTSSISGAIGTVSDLIQTGMDPNPTIRPVLDLSDVRSGVGAISGLFNDSPSLGVSSNIRAINSMMSNKNQNGDSSEVVSAINKLRKDIGNMNGSTTNNINGVTYDDGSNISSAVKTIVRAARIEGRK